MDSYICINHQAKANTFIDALASRYTAIPKTDPGFKSARFVLTDHDVLSRRAVLENFRREGLRKFFIYPHAGRPSIVSAFYQAWEHTTAQFAATDAHIEVMRRVGHPGNLHAVGWPLCPIKAFTPRAEVHNVLFAPIHPRNSPIDKKVNDAIMEKLYPLARSGRIHLTVRWLAPFEGNGIQRHDDCVTYVEGAAGPTWSQIDNSDIVIGHQTFAFLAVARGVPTLMMGEDLVPHVEYKTGEYYEARGWDDFRDLIMYPLDLLYSEDPLSMMQAAAADDESIRAWRDRMIGKPFDPKKFVDIVESYL